MSAKERLSEYEKRICYFLKEMGVGNQVVVVSEHLDTYEFINFVTFVKETIPILEYYGFVTLQEILPIVNTYVEDVFLKNYLRLINDSKKDESKMLATLCDFSEIILFGEGKLNKENIDLIAKKVPERALGQDFCSCSAFKFEIHQKLIDFVIKEIEPDFENEGDEDVEVPNKTLALELGTENEIPRIIVMGKECRIRKFSRQYEFLKIIFSDPQKDWQFSEIGEKLDFAENNEWKKLHNVALAIKAKVAIDSGLKDFFITTTQSVKINPKLLNPTKTENNPSDLDF